MLDTLWYDVRYAARMLRKTPSFTFVAVLVIALGSGAVTTIFSGASALILRPIPGVVQQRNVIDIGRSMTRGGRSHMSASYPFFTHARDETRALSGLAAWASTQLTVSTGGQ